MLLETYSKLARTIFHMLNRQVYDDYFVIKEAKNKHIFKAKA